MPVTEPRKKRILEKKRERERERSTVSMQQES